MEECRFVVDPGPTNLEEIYRGLDADDDRVWSMDLDAMACPYLPICDPIVDGLVVRLDGHHLTQAYARSLAPAVTAYLTDNGIVPR